MRCTDFAELTNYLQALNEDEKKAIWIWEDEGIVRVMKNEESEDEATLIFQSEVLHFAFAFFIMLGINVDENIEELSPRPFVTRFRMIKSLEETR